MAISQEAHGRRLGQTRPAPVVSILTKVYEHRTEKWGSREPLPFKRGSHSWGRRYVCKSEGFIGYSTAAPVNSSTYVPYAYTRSDGACNCVPELLCAQVSAAIACENIHGRFIPTITPRVIAPGN